MEGEKEAEAEGELEGVATLVVGIAEVEGVKELLCVVDGEEEGVPELKSEGVAETESGTEAVTLGETLPVADAHCEMKMEGLDVEDWDVDSVPVTQAEAEAEALLQ